MKLSRLIWGIALFFFVTAMSPPQKTHANSQMPSVQLTKRATQSRRQPSRTREFNRLVMSTAMVAPLGINPLIALGALGFAAHGGHWKAPPGLEVLSLPWVWGTLLLLGFLLKFGRSFKLTKPVAEFIGTSESVLGLISVGLVIWPATESIVSTHFQAGMASQFGLLAYGLLAYSVVCAMRTAFDILIWISPFPLVDAAFQGAKLVLTIGLLLLAIFFPWVALFVNLFIVFASLLALRWALRLTQFASILIRDMVWRKNRMDLLPREDGLHAQNDFGPLMVFNVGHPDWPKRKKLYLWCVNGRWLVGAKPDLDTARAQMESNGTVLSRGVLGYTLSMDEQKFFIPLRFEPLMNEIAVKSGARLEGFADSFKTSFAGL